MSNYSDITISQDGTIIASQYLPPTNSGEGSSTYGNPTDSSRQYDFIKNDGNGSAMVSDDEYRARNLHDGLGYPLPGGRCNPAINNQELFNYPPSHHLHNQLLVVGSVTEPPSTSAPTSKSSSRAPALPPLSISSLPPPAPYGNPTDSSRQYHFINNDGNGSAMISDDGYRARNLHDGLGCPLPGGRCNPAINNQEPYNYPPSNHPHNQLRVVSSVTEPRSTSSPTSKPSSQAPAPLSISSLPPPAPYHYCPYHLPSIHELLPRMHPTFSNNLAPLGPQAFDHDRASRTIPMPTMEPKPLVQPASRA